MTTSTNAVQFLENAQLVFSKTDNDSSIFIGKKNGKPIVVVIKNLQNNEFNPNNFTNFTQNFSNQRYSKYDCVSSSQNHEITIIYPATKTDVNRARPSVKKMVIETQQIYEDQIKPNIHRQDLTWIQNIFDKKSETDRILYEDDQFVILPDLKWSGDDMNKIYYLAIVKDKRIKSIRDLNESHIDLLNNVNNIGLNAISEKHNVDKDKFRVYFHYRPSFWHAHIHFNLIHDTNVESYVELCHQLFDVMRNIKIKSDYYTVADLLVKQKI
jgi:m7GpppX diphosphatase